MNAGLLVFILLLALSFLGIPIFVALGIGTLVALNMADLPLLVLPQKLFAGMNSSSLLAIPFFILAGNLMSRSITGKLIDVANALIGRIKGSLALVTVVASALFGAISGSGVATASAIGGIDDPRHEEGGLSRSLRRGHVVHFLHSGPHYPAVHHADRVCLHHQRVGVQAVHRLGDPRPDAGALPDGILRWCMPSGITCPPTRRCPPRRSPRPSRAVSGHC